MKAGDPWFYLIPQLFRRWEVILGFTLFLRSSGDGCRRSLLLSCFSALQVKAGDPWYYLSPQFFRWRQVILVITLFLSSSGDGRWSLVSSGCSRYSRSPRIFFRWTAITWIIMHRRSLNEAKNIVNCNTVVKLRKKVQNRLENKK